LRHRGRARFHPRHRAPPRRCPIRRGPPSRISVQLSDVDGGGVELVIEDDGSGERRKASLDSLGERARTLNARFSVEQPPEGGTRVHVALPAYVAGS